MKAAASTSKFTTRATQLIIALVVLAPALETLMGSRDLTIKDYMRTLQYDPELLVMRLATFAAVMLSVLIIGQRLLHQGKPGPASTGIPFPFLAYDGMVIEIDTIAMKE